MKIRINATFDFRFRLPVIFVCTLLAQSNKSQSPVPYLALSPYTEKIVNDFTAGEPVQQITSISGYLPAFVDTAVEIQLELFDPLVLNDSGTIYCTTTQNGSFKLEFNLSHPVNANLKIAGWDALYTGIYIIAIVEAGDAVNMRFTNGLSYSQVLFEGIGAAKFRCAQKLFGIGYSPKNDSNFLANLMRMGDSAKNVGYSIINEYKDSMSPVASVVIKGYWQMQHHTRGLKYIMNSLVPFSIRLKYQQKLTEEPVITSPDIIFNEGYFSILAQNVLLKEMCRKEILFSYLNQTMSPYGLPFQECFNILYNKSPEPLREWVLANFLASKKRGVTPEMGITINNYLSQSVADTLFHSQLKQFYNGWKKDLSTGQPAYSFALFDTAGRTVQMKDFAGKVVILDFMFNPCPSCHVMARSLESIRDHFQNSPDIVFISISIDKEIKKWKEGLGFFSAHGSIDLYTGGEGSEHPVVKYYQVENYPTVVVIDQKGRILASRAPDPRIDKGKNLIALIKNALRTK